MQVKNWWKTVGTEGKLDTIKWHKKRWTKYYIYGNVRIAQSRIITICVNAGRIKEKAWYENDMFV